MFKIHTATVNGSTGALYLYRVGNIVFFSTNGAFRSSASTIGNNTNLSQTIPYGFRPVVTTYIGFAHQGANNARFEIRNGGSIGFYGTAAWNYNAYVSGMWVTNNAMPSNGGGYLTSKFYEIFSHLERWWEYVRLKGVVSENITKAHKYWGDIFLTSRNKYHKHFDRLTRKWSAFNIARRHVHPSWRMAFQHTYNYWHDKYTNCVQRWRKRFYICDGEGVCRGQQLEFVKNQCGKDSNPRNNGLCLRLFVTTNANNKWQHKLDASNTYQVAFERGWA